MRLASWSSLQSGGERDTLANMIKLMRRLLAVCAGTLSILILGGMVAFVSFLPRVNSAPDRELISALVRIDAPLDRAIVGKLYGPEPERRELPLPTRTALAAPAGVVALRLDYAAEMHQGVQRSLPVVLVMPAGRVDVPVILMQNFCGPVAGAAPLVRWNEATREGLTDRCPDSALTPLVLAVFGRFAAAPPLQALLDEGYGVAIMDQEALLPDDADAARGLLSADDGARFGAISVWAAAFDDVAEALKRDIAAIGPVIGFGHSRYGKAVLLAAARGDGLDGVIAHQSGTGGATPLRSPRGEPIAGIVESYPHWFGASFRDVAGQPPAEYDQHLLLRAAARRPVLLGNARRDGWSDPRGAHAATIASGHSNAASLEDFRPGERIAYWLRPGTHGITEADWQAFQKWLNVQFPGSAPP